MIEILSKGWQIVFLVCLSTLIGCATTQTVKLETPKEYVEPIWTEKPIIYVSTFEDVRPYNEIGKDDFGGKVVTEEKIGEIVSKIFVDELRKYNINAISYGESKPSLGQHDFLIKGKVTDYFLRAPGLFLLVRSFNYKIGMQISVVNSMGETVMTKEFKKQYNPSTVKYVFKDAFKDFAVGGAYTKSLPRFLRELCQEVINDEEFKKIIERVTL